MARPTPTRPVLYSGQTQLLTPTGVLPLGFEIEASSLQDAIKKFPGAVKEALEQAIEEAREYRRESASRIVVPDVGGRHGRSGADTGRGQDQASRSWAAPRMSVRARAWVVLGLTACAAPLSCLQGALGLGPERAGTERDH